ncbi:SDR family NAD(P)-dependent oxidoreductase [Bosea beijingensis]
MKTWFITGAARGLGLEIARAALDAGDQVVATGREAGKIEASFSGHADRLLAVTLDVTDAPSIQAAIDAALQRFGRIDVLVNNAGYGLLASIYCASKFALVGWSESLSLELARFGIHATIVEPGTFRTDFLDRSSVAHADLSIDDYA